MKRWGTAGNRYWLWVGGLIVAVAMLGCGRKAPPIPKDATVPRAVKNLKLEKRAGVIRLTWEEPKKDLKGRKLKNLTGYKVLKKVVKPGSNECVDCPAGFREVAVLDRDHPVNFKKVEGMILWEDTDVKKHGRYVYRVVPFNANGYDGAISGYVSVKVP